MTIDVSSAYGASAAGTTPPAKAATKELDKQAFLQLLTTQLRNQDPSSPMDSSDLMAQTTQMTTMEQLIELTTTSRESFSLQMRMAAANLVGKDVTYTGADGKVTTGTVSAVSLKRASFIKYALLSSSSFMVSREPCTASLVPRVKPRKISS